MLSETLVGLLKQHQLEPAKPYTDQKLHLEKEGGNAKGGKSEGPAGLCTVTSSSTVPSNHEAALWILLLNRFNILIWKAM